MMRSYKLVYFDDSNIVEVIASVKIEDIKKFLDELDSINFEDTCDKPENYKKIKIVKNKNLISIKKSSDIKNEFKNVFMSTTINLTNFIELIYSDSVMANEKLDQVLRKFFTLFKYKLYFMQNIEDFSKVYRMVMLLGTNHDKRDYNEISESVVGNSRVIELSDFKKSISFDVEENPKEYKIVDKK